MEIPGTEVVIDKYLKRWYQFASNPHFYEPSGSYNIQALYERDASGNITVRNTLQYRGKSKTITGLLLSTTTPGKFKVKLERAILWFSITGSYNIEHLYVDEAGEYVAAIIGGGGSTYVLTSTPTISCELQAKIEARLGPERLNTLNFTAHTC